MSWDKRTQKNRSRDEIVSGAGDGSSGARPGWAAVVVPLLVLALAFVLRRWVVEPEALGFACRAGGPWWCPLRAGLIATFAEGALGAASLVTGLVSFASRRAWVPVLAASLGFAALTLYNYEFGAAGVLLGTLRLARLAAGPAGELREEHR
jgi:hypothetical protein